MADTAGELFARYVDEELDDNPVLASTLGAEGRDDRLPDLSAAAWAEREQRHDRWIAELEALDNESLALDERVVRDLVLSQLRGQRAMREWAVWKRNPDTYLQPALTGIHTL